MPAISTKHGYRIVSRMATNVWDVDLYNTGNVLKSLAHYVADNPMLLNRVFSSVNAEQN